jgi:hypothetical protein
LRANKFDLYFELICFLLCTLNSAYIKLTLAKNM